MTEREILEYRLSQAEEQIKRLEELASSISRDQLRFQLDDAKIAAHENKIEGAFKRLDELKERMIPVEHMSGRVNLLLKSLLSAFGALLIGTIVWAIQSGGVDL